jgi:hypothetical protein
MNAVIETTISSDNVNTPVLDSTPAAEDITTLPSTLQNAAQSKNATTFDNAFNRIIAERESWEQNEFARSNQKLYTILKTCYSIFQSMNSTDDEAKAYKEAFNDFCERKKFVFKGSTHLTAKIVCCVFGADRRLVSNYGRVLRIAAEKNTSLSNFVQFIEERGGVEEVRRDKKVSKSSADRAKTGKASLHGEVLGSVSSDLLNSKFDASAYTDAVLLLATKEADGSFAIRRVIQNSTVITNALASLATEVKKENEKTETEDTAVNEQKLRDDAIDVAHTA